jgi:hypothetical protein
MTAGRSDFAYFAGGAFLRELRQYCRRGRERVLFRVENPELHRAGGKHRPLLLCVAAEVGCYLFGLAAGDYFGDFFGA